MVKIIESIILTVITAVINLSLSNMLKELKRESIFNIHIKKSIFNI